MKKGAQLFSQAPVGRSSFLRHDTKIPPVVSFGRYFVSDWQSIIKFFIMFPLYTVAKIGFYMRPEFWPSILTISYVWKFAGYYSIIYLATIIGIPKDYYESAAIDGATKIQQIIRITLPLLSKTIIIMVLLSIGRIFYGDFGMIYGIIGENGILFPTTDVIDTYVYRALKTLGNFGMASAVGLYQSLMGLITICIFNGIVRKIDPEARLF